MKVLIMSFPRSGTSLLHRILKRHHDMTSMYYESLLLWRHRDKNVKTLFPGFADGDNSGEKIIYEHKYIGHKKEYTYLDYCDMWFDKFGDEAKIIQIVRHPYDQWNSVVRRKYIARKTVHTIPTSLNRYFTCVPQFTEQIMKYPNSLSIKYEDLTRNPKDCMTRLYKHCGLDPDRSRFKETITDRKSFFYKTYGHVIDKDKRVRSVRKEYWEKMKENLKGVIKVYNKIPGPKYEV